MTPEHARRALQRQIDKHGSLVTLHRQGTVSFDTKARVTGFAPQDLSGGIEQGDSLVILPAESVENSGWKEPIVPSDQLVIDGALTTVINVDDRTRRINGVLIAYQLQVRGS
jgi:hypothetical protein